MTEDGDEEDRGHLVDLSPYGSDIMCSILHADAVQGEPAIFTFNIFGEFRREMQDEANIHTGQVGPEYLAKWKLWAKQFRLFADEIALMAPDQEDPAP